MKKQLRFILAAMAALVSLIATLVVCASLGMAVAGLAWSVAAVFSWSMEVCGWPGPVAVVVTLACLGAVVFGLTREALMEVKK